MPVLRADCPTRRPAGGADVSTVDDLHAALDAVPGGGPLGLRVLRGPEELELQVSFAKAEAAGAVDLEAHPHQNAKKERSGGKRSFF